MRQTPFCSATPYSPHFGTLTLKLQRYWIPPGPSRLCKDSRQHADIPQLAVEGQSTMKKPRKKKTLTNERNTKNFLKVRRLRNDSVFISGPVKLLSRRERIQRTSDNNRKWEKRWKEVGEEKSEKKSEKSEEEKSERSQRSQKWFCINSWVV